METGSPTVSVMQKIVECLEFNATIAWWTVQWFSKSRWPQCGVSQDRGDPTVWQFLDEVVGMPAVVQSQVPRCQEMTYTEQKVQILHQIVHFPAVAQRLTRMWRRTRTVETSRLQDREVVVDVPLDQDGHISWRKSFAFSRPRRSRVPRRQRICPPLWLAR